MKVFLSHNKADKEIVRALGAALVLAGADVWFDGQTDTCQTLLKGQLS